MYVFRKEFSLYAFVLLSPLGPSLLNHSLRKMSYQEGKPEPAKQALKKSKLPLGRFDSLEDSPEERDPLQSE